MAQADLQDMCARGQELLMGMRYIEAEKVLVEAERAASANQDFDTLARLYMPLQEARRQRRQRCGEGIVRLDLIARESDDRIDGDDVVGQISHGQLLVAGWGSIDPAVRVRRLQEERSLYVETFLAAAYPAGEGRVVVIVPLEDVRLPEAQPRPIDRLLALLPAQAIVLAEADLPRGPQTGSPQTYERVMTLWERLHKPFVAAADIAADPRQRIQGYRKAIRVDYACEAAHQRLSDVARQLGRERAGTGKPGRFVS